MSPSITVTGVMTALDPMTFAVAITEGDSTSEHMATLTVGDYERLSREGESAKEFLTRCFEFLLEREPKESILRTFDVSVISRYFPEFEESIKG